jgi:hypothetical protein
MMHQPCTPDGRVSHEIACTRPSGCAMHAIICTTGIDVRDAIRVGKWVLHCTMESFHLLLLEA